MLILLLPALALVQEQIMVPVRMDLLAAVAAGVVAPLVTEGTAAVAEVLTTLLMAVTVRWVEEVVEMVDLADL